MNKITLTLVLQRAKVWSALPSKQDIHQWIMSSLMEDADVTVRLIDEDEGRNLNNQFRSKDYATNVLTFPYPETSPLSGDIALCIPVIEREARAQNKTVRDHLAHLCIHATLHLQNFDHQNTADREVMENMEINTLQKIGISNPYEEKIN